MLHRHIRCSEFSDIGWNIIYRWDNSHIQSLEASVCHGSSRKGRRPVSTGRRYVSHITGGTIVIGSSG